MVIPRTAVIPAQWPPLLRPQPSMVQARTAGAANQPRATITATVAAVRSGALPPLALQTPLLEAAGKAAMRGALRLGLYPALYFAISPKRALPPRRRVRAQFAAGLLAGVSAHVLMEPLERGLLALRRRVQGAAGGGAVPAPGLHALRRGLLTASQLSLYGAASRRPGEGVLGLPTQLPAALVSAAGASAAVAPVHEVSRRMAETSSSSSSSSDGRRQPRSAGSPLRHSGVGMGGGSLTEAAACLRHILRAEGVAGLFVNWGATLARVGCVVPERMAHEHSLTCPPCPCRPQTMLLLPALDIARATLGLHRL